VNIQALLSEKVSQALIAAGAPADCEPQVRQSAKVQFGDYQANGVMAVAKKLGMAPRQLAEQVLTHLDLDGIASKTEIAGPGFINIFLDPAFLASHVDAALKSERLGVNQPQAQTIVVDYSAPNVAKEMHVGHLRSTIIGDAAVRTLEFLGHKVIRANHVGDWGTQFGMLIAYLEKQQQENAGEMALADLEGFYREAKKHYDEDDVFAERARSYVVKLQGGDEYFLQMWRKLVDITMSQNQITYDRLNVTLTRNDVMGESLYNPMLPGIVADLKAKGLAVESEGATVVFLDEYKNKEGEPAVVADMDDSKAEEMLFSANFACPICGYSMRELEPRLFSFNNPAGACPTCDGLGVQQYFDPDRVIQNPELSLAGGAIRGWDKRNFYYFQMLKSLAEHYKFDVEAPWASLSATALVSK
jgi:arginyl-tRNA synthetase